MGKRKFSDFRGVELIILTPGFLGLKNQAMKRLAKSELVPPDGVPSRVITYKHGDDNKIRFDRFKQQALETNDKLVVMIADECHYATTVDGPHNEYANDPKLHERDNFVLLGVRYEVHRTQSVSTVLPKSYERGKSCFSQGSFVRLATRFSLRCGLSVVTPSCACPTPLKLGQIGSLRHPTSR